MELLRHGLLVGSAAVAGAINAVAGGGTLISFPAAMAWGLPSIAANVTNAVALTPGSLASAWGYRRELRADWRLVRLLAPAAALGGLLGAFILQHTSQRLFDSLIPWLVLGATTIILLQGVIVRRSRRRPASTDAPTPPGRLAVVVVCQFLVGVYGGYFGAAMGIIMLAFLSLVASTDIHGMNGIKNLMAALVNGVASIYFVASGLVDAEAALMMMGGAVLGGFVGARLARRAPARVIRALVVVIGFGLSALLAYRRFAQH
ncbi:MAG TPA: sulfite exporter TauE/SafE family protein [Polyangia bacterium]|nr:sulfite exporter TauE/SafE family protein [Polyangia bacterium]